MRQPLNWNVVVQSSNFPHFHLETALTLTRGPVNAKHAWFILTCTESEGGRGKPFASPKFRGVFSLVHLSDAKQMLAAAPVGEI